MPRLRPFLPFLATILLISCDSAPEMAATAPPPAVAPPATAAPTEAASPVPQTAPSLPEEAAPPEWANALLADFIARTESSQVKASREAGKHVGWLYDQLRTTDTARYFVFHLGHDVAEPDGSDARFATDGWVYIDTLTHRIYEQDIAADSLIEWHPQ